ncbi:MAG: putative PAS/PAC sensor protein [Spirochaetes bacterium]|nr:MAG: putative PAS/PAC sensor protein [Spirochaetota bacterium]
MQDTNRTPSSNAPLRFLLVEDNPDDAFLLIHNLKSNFPAAHFELAANRRELLRKLSSPVAYDIVLSDWSLPQMDGIAVLSLVRSVGIDAPIIIVSGKIGEEAAIRAIREGVYDYILKDSLSRLPMAIRHALMQHSQDKKAKINNELITLLATALQAAPVAIEILDSRGSIEWVNEAYRALTGRGGDEVLGREARNFEDEGDAHWLESLFIEESEDKEVVIKGRGRKADGNRYFEERRVCPVRDQSGRLTHFVVIRKDFTSLEQEKKELELDLSFSELARKFSSLQDLCQAYIALAERELPEWTLGIRLFSDGDSHAERLFGSMKSLDQDDSPRDGRVHMDREITLGKEILAKVRLAYLSDSVLDQERLVVRLLSNLEISMRELVAQARVRAQIKNISFLKHISRTINANMEFDMVMGSLLDQVRSILECDAVAFYLADSDQETLECKAMSGFNTNLIYQACVKFGQPNNRIVVEERRVNSVYDFETMDPSSTFGTLIDKENFISQHGAPIIMEGEMKGALEVWFRREFKPGSEWFVLFDAIANQVGIALDYNAIYADLQKAYLDLETSYEATIEGWSAAMDLRDEETEGHSRRVTTLSLSLAAKLGLPEAEIAQIRQGAFLHDIGKIGIPDSILKKPGPLNEEEWTLMKQHPKKALDLLGRIPYLKDSLDIPLYHHEKFDGTGYPHGLAGEKIPLSARLFSIIDVFDALTSDRPYRRAWAKEKAIDHLREQKGKHFDPSLVEAFISLVD